uniref:Protein kinase domain-containing protein n=1 Tax=Hydatigena taeniaeformis TaxID=6205 RepID=A0A0R3WME8_HYDTA
LIWPIVLFVLCIRSEEEFDVYVEKVKFLFNIPEEEIQIERKSVSGGNYGDVSFGTYRRINVVKKDFRRMATKTEWKYNYREACTLAACNHQNIVKFIGAGPDTGKAYVRYVVIERATNASLAELIRSDVQYSIWHVMLWNLHLADGLEYLHSRPEPIIHRDLKPANMLLFDDCTILKISDFGSSKIFELGKEELQSVNQGSLLYMAPEVHQRRFDENYTRYTEKVDIYSMAVSTWEMLTRKLDQNVNPHSTKIRSCPSFLRRLIACGMAEDPDQRPSAPQLVQLLDFIMRKVCTKNTLELSIDFEGGGIPDLYQQAHTYSINSNTDSVPGGIHWRKSPGDGQESPRYATLETPECPTDRSQAAIEMYQRHVELAKEYVRLSKELKRLKKLWEEKVAQIITTKKIQSWQVDSYKKRIKEYCELYVIMMRNLLKPLWYRCNCYDDLRALHKNRAYLGKVLISRNASQCIGVQKESNDRHVISLAVFVKGQLD